METNETTFARLNTEQRQALAAYWLCQKKPGGNYNRQADLKPLLGDEGLTRSDLSRLANDAMKSGYFTATTIHHLSLPAELLHWVKTRTADYSKLENVLRRLYPCLNRLIVAHAATSDPLTSDEDWDASVEIFAERLTPLVLNLLQEQGDGAKQFKIGIGWGRTLASLVNAIQLRQPQLALESNGLSGAFSVFPTWGSLYRPLIHPSSSYDSLSVQTVGASSSSLAGLLNQALGNKETPSIHGLPAIVPKKWADGGLETFQRRRDQFLHDIAAFTSYEDIFGLPQVVANGKGQQRPQKKALIESMDCAIVTMGSASHPTRFYSGNSFSHYFGSESREDKQFHEHCVGDIGGVLLAKGQPEQSQKADRFLNRISEFFLCTKRDHLLELAKKAQHDPSSLGVLAIVHGSKRVDVVQRALSDGLVTTLCICSHLAKALSSAVDVRVD